ncbi:HlyD family efflux transporter periplasmic adaptor subunit [Thalassospira mesophila]|uniref:HlyD family efflux transporter periplasmic adaptor subunit n=1 Tax=Thalassospira mesophila TaxID=1293891 RepID=UPI000A1F7E67|nr:HlyD family efflux transporter periplasmic adaptor subunit [Thalassospira mesophila]
MAAPAVSFGQPGPQQDPPPVLRRDLDIVPGEPERNGRPVYILHDAAAGRHFQLDPVTVDLLPLIDGRPADKISQLAEKFLGHTVSVEEITRLFGFLRAHNLVLCDDVQHGRHKAQLKMKPGFAAKLVKSYISFRLPLLTPDLFLNRTIGYVRWLASSPMVFLHVCAALAGIYLVSRQPDVFLHTLRGFLSFEGIVAYGLAVTAVKSVHELSHAYTAKAHGLRVPVIGVAFIVFWPVLYTDTTDAWRLPSRRDRLEIGAAGVLCELVIAAWSMLLWNLFPDGPIGSILFLFGTSTWVLSLFVNLNPLMRYDGYYLFSDLVRERNLESRAHAVCRWKLREVVLGLGAVPPEKPTLLLMVFGFSIWVYRLLLFFGIALAVYHLFFKTLGIALFLVEIYFFIARPIIKEIVVWFSFGKLLKFNFALMRSLLVLGLFLVWLLVPWQGEVSAPAVLTLTYNTVYAPMAARVENVTVKTGQMVKKGDVIAHLQSPELDERIEVAELKRAELAWENASIGVDALRQNRALVLASQFATQERVLRGQQAQQQRLVLRAPVSGKVVDMNDTINQGAWIGADEPVLSVVEDGAEVIAYLDELSLPRIEPGASATFYSEDGVMQSIQASVSRIDATGVTNLTEPYMRSQNGGPIETVEQPDKSFVPGRAIYRVILKNTTGASVPSAVRGKVIITARPESQFSKLSRRMVSLLQRESQL